MFRRGIDPFTGMVDMWADRKVKPWDLMDGIFGDLSTLKMLGLLGFYGIYMVEIWSNDGLMGFNGGLMGFNSCLMGFIS